MKCMAMILMAVVLVASLCSGFVSQQQPLCVWQSNPETVSAGCNDYCGAPFPSCCKHWHLNLQYNKCTSDGDLLKDKTTKKYFVAQSAQCNFNCTGTGTATCSHYVNDCTTKACPVQ